MLVSHTSRFCFCHSSLLSGAESRADRIARYELKLFMRRRCCNKNIHISVFFRKPGTTERKITGQLKQNQKTRFCNVMHMGSAVHPSKPILVCLTSTYQKTLLTTVNLSLFHFTQDVKVQMNLFCANTLNLTIIGCHRPTMALH